MNAPAWARGLLMDETRALAERTAAIREEHTIRGMFMISTLECLRRAQGEGAVSAALAASGMKESAWGQMKKVPLADFNTLRTVVGRMIAPNVGGMEAAVARIAGVSVDIFFESVAGRTMMLLAGKDPHRLMSAAPNGYGLAVDDGATRKYQKISETEGLFSFAGDRLGPCHQVGVFSAAVHAVCGIDINVEITQPSLLDFEFRVTW